MSFGCLKETQLPQFVSIPDNVEETSESCLRELKKVFRLAFGESSFNVIDKTAFYGVADSYSRRC